MSLIGLALSVLVGVSLGFFGGGGSILTVPLLVYVFGLAPKEAIASSLVIVGLTSISAVAQHWRRGNVRLRAGLIFGAAGMLAAYLGGRVGAYIDGGLLLLLFAAMMLITAGAMWRGRKTPREIPSDEQSPLRLALQGFAVGSFTGLVGAGGGFLIVPALALWAGLPMPIAIGTSLMIIVLNTASGFAGYLSHVGIEPTLVAAVTACAIGGSLLGSRLTRLVEPGSLRRAFAGFVLAMAAFILVREGTLLVTTIGPALPNTLAQLAFSIVMLAVGVLAGRSSRAVDRRLEEAAYDQGAGI